MAKTSNAEQADKGLKWWQLSLLGVACTIGTGYFLGSSIGIQLGGPSIIIAFLLAAIATYMVFDVLAKMTAENPQKGSFRTYAKKAFGRWAGFGSGWVYWSSELLIMGSQLTALSLFSRFWLPTVPIWLFTGGYGLLGLLIIAIGTKGFDRLENAFAVIKISAIIMFLIIAALALTGLIDGGVHQPKLPLQDLFPTGITGFLSCLIYAFYAFAGIEVMGIMAMRLHHPEQAPKSGKMMLVLLTVVYVLSMTLALTLVPWGAFNSEESPFVAALRDYDLAFLPHVFNGIFIIAGFSTMAGALFGVTTMLVTLAEDRDAPAFFAKKWKRKLPLPALGLTTVGMIASVLMALIMPGQIYEYLTTAAGLMLLYNWLFILLSSGRLLELTGWARLKRYLGMALIVVAVGGTLLHSTTRPGFMVSMIFIAVIGILILIMRPVWEKRKQGSV
jgi:L-asparagine transporter-like permease